uniref:Uncharacterized protein n=1 Tax=Leersia perrieri TaxID=77586 RepID=A0A0D9WXC9_9ORYZ
MSDSEKQAAEVSKGTDDIQMDPPRLKIRLRLPPRKRLSNGLLKAEKEAPRGTSNGLLKAEKEAPRGTSNAQSNRVPAPIKIKIPIKKLTTTGAQRCTGRISTRGLCNESDNNNLSRTLPNEPYCDTSSNKLSEEANGRYLKKPMAVQARIRQSLLEYVET